MKLFVSGASATMRQLMPHPNLGYLITPASRQDFTPIIQSGADWGCDNGCYGGLNEGQYCSMVDALVRRDTRRLQFVTVPDVVADHGATLELWQMWYPYVAEVGLRPAFVLQDGATSDSIPWHELATLFIGGSTEYKESRAVQALIIEARTRGKWIHIGRVSTARRERLFIGLADSIDSSAYSQFSATLIPPALRRLAQYDLHQRCQLALPI